MSLSSPVFIFAFLPLSFFAHRAIKSGRGKNICLALLSLLFLSFGKLWHTAVLLLSLLLYYFAGLAIKRSGSRFALGASIAAALGILCAFKYSGNLPLGISYFSFQGISYLIDVFRDRELATKDPVKLLLCIAFFPRLSSGPIVKYHELEHQIDNPALSPEMTASGIEKFIIGLAKKLLIADFMAKAVTAFKGAEDFRCAWLFAVCYMLQLYYDFSGYSDMAIGLGRIFGYDFGENFLLPYGSASLKEFWRKWHISLSSWFRDYLYIPLGGNRKGKLRAAFNRLAVFLCTGLWHGAGWTFLFWGAGHWLLVTLEDLKIIPVKALERSRAGRILCRAYTLLSVMLLFVIFRCETLSAAFFQIGAMFTAPAAAGSSLLLASVLSPAFCFSLLAGLLLAGRLPEKLKTDNRILKESACLALFLLCLCAMARGDSAPFIYAQF